MIHADLQAAAEVLASGTLTRVLADHDGPDPDLATALYAWYTNAVPLPVPRGGPLGPIELDPRAALRAAHHDTTRFGGGWRAESVSTWGRTSARKGDVVRVLDRSEYAVLARPGMRAQPGDALLVSRCWDWIDDDTGYWHVRRGDWPPPGADRLVRLYWNTEPGESPRLVEVLSTVLAGEPSVPYIMKTPASAHHVGRADALVLYLGPDGFAAVERPLRSVASDEAGRLRRGVPRFTLPLSGGAAIAEGSLEGDSFGETRCAIVAGAYLGADPAARHSPVHLAECLGASFRAAGLDPRRPYLERGATRDYVA